jgi:4-deoxy-L-threo-5-hexosulose-uronate ketol-isomerase
MTPVEIRHAVDPESVRALDTGGLRAHFHMPGLFRPGAVRLVYTHYYRMIVGGAVPDGGALVLDEVQNTGTQSLLERREMVVANIGETGKVSAAGVDYALDNSDMLYLSMGSGPVTLSGKGRFYLISAPAHQAFPSRIVRPDEATRLDLGSTEDANKRILRQYIHPGIMPTCQIVMGMTTLAPGSTWNTMPAHLHDRRSEVYLYFGMAEKQRVFHMMGEPGETRHLVMANEEAVVSPSWSIHCGSGTAAYSFIWAMAGDNVGFTDMDPVKMEDLR